MNSLLGVEGDEIQLKVGLKVGDARETKIFLLHLIKTVPSPTPPPAK